jgi:Protein of unknown function (DUF3352)
VRRAVVAVTSLLVTLGAAVVISYLLLFSAVADRAARAAPADSAAYLNVYLQPSVGQQMNLFGLIGRLRGFGDAAAVEGKIDEVAQRLLGQAGIDYLNDVHPWLGAQVAVAIAPGKAGGAPQILLLAAVKDAAAAQAAVPRLLARGGATFTPETYRGQATMTGTQTSYALLGDLLLVATTPAWLHAALDAESNRAPSLADSPAFRAAMSAVVADHLASVYLDLPRTVGIAAGGHVGGYRTVALALTAAPDGLHLNGSVPFAADAASEEARAAHVLGARSSTLAAWMPRTTSAEGVVFGLAQSFADLEATIANDGALATAADALNQLRVIAALGLGVNVDRDLFPLLDGEVAVALEHVAPDGPHGQVLLRPGDPAAGEAALERIRLALADRGSAVTTQQVEGSTVTVITVPLIGRIAYAVVDEVVLLALDPADVAAAIQARAAGQTLGDDERYSSSFELAGAHAGNEIWADLPSLTDALAGIIDPGSEVRDILHQIGELAMSASASDDRLEIKTVLTVR